MGILRELHDKFHKTPTGWNGNQRHKAIELQYPQHNRKTGSQRRWQKVKLGATVTNVLSALGLPDELHKGLERADEEALRTLDCEDMPWDLIWWYDLGRCDESCVVFKKEKVVGFRYSSSESISGPNKEIVEGVLEPSP